MQKKHSQGQIAIFVVLIFQVLFILFGMTINVAMTVYDKINFQNALDLAAYYGAKQQAEVLNAMAHINYQMRQNWKLLSWRYRILGTLTQDKGHPHNQSPKAYWCPQNKLSNGNGQNIQCSQQKISFHGTPIEKQKCSQAKSSHYRDNNIYPGYCDSRYFICTSNNAWIRGIEPNEQNLCQLANITIPPIPEPAIPGNILPIANVASHAIDKLRQEIGRSCPKEGALNALLAHLFLIHFREDQQDRRGMIQHIFKKSLEAGNDLNGDPILKGASKVFCNNLSQNNLRSINPTDSTPEGCFSSDVLQDFNSVEDKDFEVFFEPIRVTPVLQILDLKGNQSSVESCPSIIRPHYDTDGSSARPTPNGFDIKYKITTQGIINRLYDNPNPHPLYGFLNQPAIKQELEIQIDVYNMSNYFNPQNKLLLGFSKKTDQQIYYGLRIELPSYKPNIFALPLPSSQTILFKASSIAKPFGGVFGPKPKSDPFIKTTTDPNNINPYTLQPNYSRYPGDPWGLIDYKIHDPAHPSRFLNKLKVMKHNSKRVWTIDAFFRWTLYAPADIRDPLAWPFQVEEDEVSKSFMRLMELIAIHPDIYDLSHYSIAGNYMQTYFPKICKLLTENKDNCNQLKLNPEIIKNIQQITDGIAFDDLYRKTNGLKKYYIRGDLGWPYPDLVDANGKALSIAPVFLEGNLNNSGKIIPLAYNHFSPTSPHPNTSPLRVIGKSFQLNTGPYALAGPILNQDHFGYPWLAQLPEEILSSWAPPIPENGKMDYSDYTPPQPKGGKLFMKCDTEVTTANKPNTSGCIVGGRSGYSVKLISCSALEDNSPLKNDTEWCSQ